LYLVGRSKDVIIKSGINIYPAEIEQVLIDHPAVEDAVAVAWEHPERGEDIAIFVVTNKRTSEKALILYCQQKLASYKVPKGIFFIKNMPKTTLGKIIKADLIAKLPST
jgi:long-chain acyl-CoA synthetase